MDSSWKSLESELPEIIVLVENWMKVTKSFGYVFGLFSTVVNN